MRYIFYKDPNGNFGDDLNGWLWPKIFGGESVDDTVAFLGIGSIIMNNHKIITDLGDQRKVVFGTGVRHSYSSLKYNSSWDVKFLRGPLSSAAFNNKFDFITDAAYALRLTDDYSRIINSPKKYEVSLMPYFRSVAYFDWPLICKKLGYHYISPLSENGVQFTLEEIAASRYVITEAMHGAIVADILRVPWSRYVLTTPYTEGPVVSEFKWMDWQLSMNLTNIESTLIQFYRPSFLNPIIKRFTFGMVDSRYFVKSIVVDEILSKLSKVSVFYLSKDDEIDLIDSKIYQKINVLKEELTKLL